MIETKHPDCRQCRNCAGLARSQAKHRGTTYEWVGLRRPEHWGTYTHETTEDPS